MDRLYKEREVSVMTGIPQGTLRWMRSQGIGPEVIRIGSRVYYDENAVDTWIKAHQESRNGGAA